MRRCPKCNRTYSTDTQKFCTHDGGLLFAVQAELTETVQFDSSKVRDAVAKPTTRDLSDQQAAAFDPEATVVRSSVNDGTQQVKARDTGSLEPPSQTQYYGAPPSQPSTGPVAPPPVTPSGPIPPPQTSAPLPPPPPQGSGPIPPPPEAQAAAAAHSGQPMPPSAQKKKSKLPLILGILAVVIVLFVGAAVVVGYFVWKNKGRDAVTAAPPASGQGPSASSLPPTAPPSDASNPSAEPPPYSPPPNAEQFVNSKTNLDGKLLEHYVDFSFYYPGTWQKDADAGVSGASNFAKVERRLPPDFTQENFAVGWYSATGTSTELFKNLAENLSKQLSTGFPEYRKVSEGPTRVGVYDGYEFRFEGMSRNTAKGDVTIWGRVVFLPPPSGGSTGVTLLMLTTSLAPELESVDDVGVKGELPMVLESFRFGK
ncbi:MAG TPA: hypothetical protein VJV21_07785 [Pyrinomonadaceae bacterium]|nr:hypothetical protein [Pyrinomonadaceae bacterium]